MRWPTRARRERKDTGQEEIIGQGHHGATPSRTLNRAHTGTATGLKAVAAAVLPLGFYALTLGGAVAGVGAWAAIMDGPGTEPAAQVPAEVAAEEQASGAFAAAYVSAWLTATEENPGQLGAYSSLDALDLPQKVPAYRDLTIASVSAREPGELSAVLLTAQIADPETSSSGWVQRWYQVTVNTAGGGFSAVGLPAPVAAPPAASAAAPLAYAVQVSAADPLVEAIRAFLTAYATGHGDLEPVSSPDSQLAPISPAPYDTVELLAVSAVEKPPSPPDTGEVAHVLVQTRLTAQHQPTTATYALTLTTRDGRWETTAVEPRPRVMTPATTEGQH